MVLKVSIITPESIIWNNNAEKIVLPTTRGKISVMYNHSPLITSLDIGITLIYTKKKKHSFLVVGGFALIKNNYITLLVNEAKMRKFLDFSNIEKLFQRTKKKLKSIRSDKERLSILLQYKYLKAQYLLFKQKKF